MGGKNVTVKKLSILRVENNKIFVNGSIPGSDNGIVYINEAEVVTADIVVSNGVIHFINRVLQPLN